MIVINLDIGDLPQELESAKLEYQMALERGFAEASQTIVERFRANQLSGRTGADTGLNIRTGRLYQSIRSLTQTAVGFVRGIVFNQGAQYWAYHQDPDGQKKRLFLEEDFETYGSILYQSKIELAFAKLAA